MLIETKDLTQRASQTRKGGKPPPRRRRRHGLPAREPTVGGGPGGWRVTLW
jgi:hypothetical protein